MCYHNFSETACAIQHTIDSLASAEGITALSFCKEAAFWICIETARMTSNSISYDHFYSTIQF